MASYNETDPTPMDLDLSTPTEGATPPAEVNNAIREVKRVLKVESAIVTTAGNLSLTELHSTILVNGAHTLTLPTIADVSSSTFTKRYRIINISGSTGVLKTAAGGETLNGADYSSTGLNLPVQYKEYLVYGNGTVWYMEQALIADAISEFTAAAEVSFPDDIKVANIHEIGAGNGVTVDSCTIKDGGVEAVTDQGGGSNLLCKIIDIGDWNMNTTTNVVIAHGVTLSKIRSVLTVIRNDVGSGGLLSVFGGAELSGIVLDGYIHVINTVSVILRRTGGGIYDAAGFSDTSYNRGWITVWYTE